MASAAFVTDLTEIITQALEGAAMVGSLWSSFGVVDLARSYYNLYNTQRQFYYTTFQLGAEAPLAVSVYNVGVVTTDYAGSAAQLYSGTGIFGGPMGDVTGWWARHGLAFGLPQSRDILNDEAQQDYQLIQSQWINVMYRFSEVNFDLLSEQRWDHRMKLHNVAMKQMSAVLGSLASSVEQREDTMSARASNFADMSNSAAQRRGLVQGHKDVQARYASLANASASTYGIMKDQGNPAAMKRAPYSASTFALNSSDAITGGQALFPGTR